MPPSGRRTSTYGVISHPTIGISDGRCTRSTASILPPGAGFTWVMGVQLNPRILEKNQLRPHLDQVRGQLRCQQRIDLARRRRRTLSNRKVDGGLDCVSRVTPHGTQNRRVTESEWRETGIWVWLRTQPNPPSHRRNPPEQARVTDQHEEEPVVVQVAVDLRLR